MAGSDASRARNASQVSEVTSGSCSSACHRAAASRRALSLSGSFVIGPAPFQRETPPARSARASVSVISATAMTISDLTVLGETPSRAAICLWERRSIRCRRSASRRRSGRPASAASIRANCWRVASSASGLGVASQASRLASVLDRLRHLGAPGVAGFEVIDREIAHHGEEERFEIPRLPVGIGARRGHEGVLDQIFSVAGMADADARKPDQLGAMSAVEVGQGRARCRSLRSRRCADLGTGLQCRPGRPGQRNEVGGQGTVGHGRG